MSALKKYLSEGEGQNPILFAVRNHAYSQALLPDRKFRIVDSRGSDYFALMPNDLKLPTPLNQDKPATPNTKPLKGCLITLKSHAITKVRVVNENNYQNVNLYIFDIIAESDERKAELANVSEQMFGRAYVNSSVAYLKKQYSDINQQLSSAQHAEWQARRNMTEAIRKINMLNELQDRYEKLFSDKNKSAELKVKEEYKKLLDNPRLRGIILKTSAFNSDEPTSLEVYTKTIFCKDPRTNKIHEIGDMKIVVEMDGNVRITNLTRSVKTPYIDGAQAPHVDAQSTPCFGNIGQTISELIAKHEFVMLINALIAFLESCNVADSRGGANIDCWPFAKEEKSLPKAINLKKKSAKTEGAVVNEN